MSYEKQFVDIIKETLPEGAILDWNEERYNARMEQRAGRPEPRHDDMMFITYHHPKYTGRRTVPKESDPPAIALVASSKYCKQRKDDPQALDHYLRKIAEHARKAYLKQLGFYNKGAE